MSFVSQRRQVFDRATSSPGFGFDRAAIAALAAVLVLGSLGCSRDKVAREGRVTRAQADQYMRDAIRQSSEGVVLEPSQKGLDQIERTRLNEIAQQLRRPGAVCFLERAIATMEPGEIDGEQVWAQVPEGQAKFRVRVAVDGTVLTTDLLESGFQDEYMDTCLTEALTRQRFVESRDSFAYFIDVYYWVSLGFFAEANTEQFAELMRRQQAQAGLRAKACLTGRVGPGEYRVTGLNLFDRDGSTLINRVDRGELPSEVSGCIAAALKAIRIHPEPDAFVRPAAPEVVFRVDGEGLVSIADELWLQRVELEERAQREMKRAELLEQVGAGAAAGGVTGEVPNDWSDTDLERDPEDSGSSGIPIGAGPGVGELGEGEGLDLSPRKPRDISAEPAPEPDTGADADTDPPAKPSADPTEPGTKIELSPRRRPG
jgi:hypothetical protein